MDAIKVFIDGISALLGLIGVCLFGFILIMGLAHKSGRRIWFEKEKDRRTAQGKPNITLATTSDKPEMPWNDPSLVQGGLTALGTIGLLFIYVVAMLVFIASQQLKPLTANQTLYLVALLMGYPVAMGAFSVISLAFANIRQFKLQYRAFWFLFGINLVCAIATFFVARLQSSQSALLVQIFLLVIVSLSLSYIYGMRDGLKDADVEARFPLVEVLTTRGDSLKQIRLYEKTDTDYRFIGADGVDHILPGMHVAEIKYPLEKPAQEHPA
jgi:hypothetical protein